MTRADFPTDESESTSPRFQPISNPPGVEIFDPIEKVRFELYTSGSPTLQQTETDGFPFPMDSAVTFSTRRIVVPYEISVNFWNGEQTVVEQLGLSVEELSVPSNEYYVTSSSP
ncbi:hypothetical protein [Haladaptatus sp. NG-WS-4]